MFKKISKNIKEKRINIARYTRDAYLKIMPDGKQDKWEETTCPQNASKFICRLIDLVASDKKNSRFNRIGVKVVTIDDDYFAWLDGRHITHSDKSLIDYMEQISEAKCEEKSKAHGLNKVYSYCNIIFSAVKKDGCYKKKTDFRLDESKRADLLRYLEEIFGEGKVFLPGYIVDNVSALNNRGRFMDMAETYFETNRDVRLGLFDEQENNTDSNCALFIIPFAVKGEYKSINIDDINEYVCRMSEASSSYRFTDENSLCAGAFLFGADKIENLLPVNLLGDNYDCSIIPVISTKESLTACLQNYYMEYIKSISINRKGVTA